VLTIALVGGLLAVSSAPAQAAPPSDSSNFNPQDALIGADGLSQLLLSDQFDGVDQQAHLTSVAVSSTVSATFVICPPGGFAAPGPIPPAGCTVIGTDTEGKQVTGGGGDEAYELFWNIPFNFDNVTRDVGVYHCTGNPGGVEPGGNCNLEVEPDVLIEDAQNPGGETSAAELVDYCVDANGDGDCEAADGDTSVKPLTHGQDVPNLGAYPATAQYVVTATGSANLNELTLCTDTPADAQNEPDSCALADASPAAASGAFNNYTFEITTPDNSEMSWWLHNFFAGSSGTCAVENCLFDNHYVVSSEPAATAAAVTFDVTGADCDTPDTEETNDLAEDEDVILCLTDQFGDPFEGPATIESSSTDADTSGFEVCDGGAGVLHDHNADGYFEHCHGTTGPDGELPATIGNPSDNVAAGPAHPGTQTLTGCSDVQNDPVDPPADPPILGHGCADETVTGTATKTWITHPTHVHLVFFSAAEPGGADPLDPCHTGDQNKENTTGDVDDLLACTFDDFDNPISTEGEGNGRLQWFIVPSGGGELTATRFLPGTSPPSDTTGPEAQAAAQIQAFRTGNDIISVELENVATGSGVSTDDDVDQVQKRVTGAPKPKIDSTITIKGKFRGKVKSAKGKCRKNRTVILKKVRPGSDKTVGTDKTNAQGKWKIKRPNAKGRFYAKAQRKETLKLICRKARSKTVKR
jgi:hypothetical protein